MVLVEGHLSGLKMVLWFSGITFLSRDSNGLSRH
jgi:hypothetical protein